jgi:hypothetical protein
MISGFLANISVFMGTIQAYAPMPTELLVLGCSAIPIRLAKAQ